MYIWQSFLRSMPCQIVEKCSILAMMKYLCLYLLRTSILGAASWHLQPRKPRSITLVIFRDVRILEVLLIFRYKFRPHFSFSFFQKHALILWLHFLLIINHRERYWYLFSFLKYGCKVKSAWVCRRQKHYSQHNLDLVSTTSRILMWKTNCRVNFFRFCIFFSVF